MNCVVTLSIRKPDGSALSGVSVSARVDSENTTVNTDSSGIATFVIDSGSRVKFLCSDVAKLNGLAVKLPQTSAYSVGTFEADALAESEAGEDGGGGVTFEAAANSPADGMDDEFTFTGTPVMVFRNGVNETRLGTIAGSTFTFDSAPDADDDVEGLI